MLWHIAFGRMPASTLAFLLCTAVMSQIAKKTDKFTMFNLDIKGHDFAEICSVVPSGRFFMGTNKRTLSTNVRTNCIVTYTEQPETV